MMCRRGPGAHRGFAQARATGAIKRMLLWSALTFILHAFIAHHVRMCCFDMWSAFTFAHGGSCYEHHACMHHENKMSFAL